MKVYLLVYLLIFGAITSCDQYHKGKHEDGKLELGDNLYSDDEGNLFLKSREQEFFDSGRWVNVWISTVYYDTCIDQNGESQNITLKDVVDPSSFTHVRTDSAQGGDFYKDKNFNYFHKWMADGGTISLSNKN